MNPRISTLENGLRIVSEPMPSLQSAAIGLWVSAGGRHERIDQNGIAHFLEHMAFKGTTKRSALQIAEEIEDVGGYINAYTSKEVTAYYSRCLAADVPLALDIIADIVLNPVFDPREVEVERHVILQEIGQALDAPDDIIFDWLHETSYPNQAFGRSILGPPDRVESFKRDDFIDFVRAHYTPERMIISAAGAVDHDKIVEQVSAVFANIPMGEKREVEKALFIGGERRENKALEQAHFALSFEAPAISDDDVYTAQVYATAMGGGMSSRLFQKVREEHGLCYSIFAQAAAHDDTGTMTIYAGTSEQELVELTHLIISELKKAPQNLNEVEIARSRTQLKGGLLMGLETPAARMERNARLLAIWGYIPTVEETAAKITSVTHDDVCRFGAQVINAPCGLALYGPVSQAPAIDDIRNGLAG